MARSTKVPGLRWSSLFIVALALAIGWGIRGNFGHEYGAMVPGALAAIAACLLSGREDWRRRVVYFGVFGGLGWGFGGSISYMQVIAYTHSGHALTQWYGFVGLFVIGFLWAAMGGAGTALPAVATRRQLIEFFRPLLWVFGGWALFGVLFTVMSGWLERMPDSTWQRHNEPFYWFDADWIQAVVALVSLCLFDLFDRRFAKFGRLLGWTILGAITGFLLQGFLELTGLMRVVTWAFVHSLGDTSRFAPEDLMTNWPVFFANITPHLGWVFGLIAGGAHYFYHHGQWRSGSRLFVYMASGWLISFLAFPVLGLYPLLAAGMVWAYKKFRESGRRLAYNPIALGLCWFIMAVALLYVFPRVSVYVYERFGGVRMTPPRSDDWAGILGVFCATMLYCFRSGLAPVAYASVVSGLIGGLGFSGIQLMKLLAMAPGNPQRLNPAGLVPSPNAATEAAWAHWQYSNWHSVLEQSYGFVNGIGIAIVMGLLASRLASVDEEAPRRRWTEVFAASFVAIFLTYVNLVKNVVQWSPGPGHKHGWTMVPTTMKMPLVEGIELSSLAWFNIVYAAIACGIIYLLIRHSWKRLAILPDSWLGRGQLLFLVLLWAMVIGNFERALPQFSAGRLMTEGVIFLNAVIVTVCLLGTHAEEYDFQPKPVRAFGLLVWRAACLALIVGSLATYVEMRVTRVVYDDQFTGGAGEHHRFGPDADWRIKPIRKSEQHK